jgi:hypothetical protein
MCEGQEEEHRTRKRGWRQREIETYKQTQKCLRFNMKEKLT